MFHSQCFQLRVPTVFILALVSKTRLLVKSKEALELPSFVPVVTTLLLTPWSFICSCLCCHFLCSLDRSWLNRIVSGGMSTISLPERSSNSLVQLGRWFQILARYDWRHLIRQHNLESQRMLVGARLLCQDMPTRLAQMPCRGRLITRQPST